MFHKLLKICLSSVIGQITMLEYYYHGVVAHLGERIAGSDEVASSSLVSSTVFRGMKHSPFFCSIFQTVHNFLKNICAVNVSYLLH